ncbi:MAG TPA: hypothetical protein VMY35_19435 [Phycisphaerae bacterium]|nr:hypothetical protein [Phycisphaerae bacterium]
MLMTVEQIQTLHTAAIAAINAGELSFATGGRSVTFHSLESFQKYIEWLEGMHAKVTEANASAAGTGGWAPKVRYGEVTL